MLEWFESSSGGFVLVVVLEGFGLVLWSRWRMVLWCWNEEWGLFGKFQSDVGGREHVCGSRCMSLWNCESMWIFGLFEVVGGGGGFGVVEVA